ncbi:MAG: kelch repeat-containing protein [Planctomycetota bacterium]
MHLLSTTDTARTNTARRATALRRSVRRRSIRRAPVVTALAAAFAGAVLAPDASAQLELDYRNGRLSDAVTFAFEGGPGEFVLFLPSAFPGPTPLSIVEPLDPRLLEVGLDLFPGYLVIAPLDPTGRFEFTWSLPDLPAIAGANLYAHAVSLGALPPMSPLFGDLANALRFTLVYPGAPSLTAVPAGVARRFHTATPFGGGPVGSERVLLLGGESPTSPFGVLSNWEVYDPSDETFTAGAGALLDRRTRHEAVALASGRVLVTGGIGGAANATLDSAEIYLPGLDQMQAAAPMNFRRVGHTATVLQDGRVLVVGGFSGPYTQDHPLGYPDAFLGSAIAPTAFAQAAEVYDPATNTWTQVPSIGPRAGHDAVLLGDGTVLIAGGIVPGAPTPVETTQCLRFDPSTNVATTTSPLPGPRAYASMSPESAGGALLSGGGPVVLGVNQVTVGQSGQQTLRYDRVTGTWIPVANEPTSTALVKIKCVRMPDGSIRYVRIECLDDRIDPTVGAGPSRVHVLDTVNNVWLLDGTTFDRRPGARVTPVDSRARFLVSGSALNAIPGGTVLPDRTVEAYPYPK